MVLWAPPVIGRDFGLPDAQESVSTRPQVAGKFLNAAGTKLRVRGVTYGTFGPDPETGQEYLLAKADLDLRRMATAGINAVRTYTPPPTWFLDLAQQCGIRVMVGLPWEQHVTFLDDRDRCRDIERRIAKAVGPYVGHPAILCYAIGNEIPAPIVRWHGAQQTEGFLNRLYETVKRCDPDGLVTYVNYPSTEYLNLPFLDLVAFNVYLEQPDSLRSYIARLQNIAGDRPLILAEVGLDSRSNGLEKQAEVLDWQIRTISQAGAAGTFIFSWTDEWHRGGQEIADWDFGLTDRNRAPKPALAAVTQAYKQPLIEASPTPRVSVVVCSYNGARTIRRCLEALEGLQYPDYEVIVVDDGSTDDTARITRQYHVRVIATENRGLSSARNTGLHAATGEIVAFIDDDAFPDPDWLTYLVDTFNGSDYAAIGGPNIPPSDAGLVAQAVAASPGGPTHVLLSDTEAEHIPGCNMAFRRDALLAIGGFDPTFRIAGDDVDACWRIQERGWKIGFSPAAMVWHHRRDSVHAYWKQQTGYGRAEALLEQKWPERYNSAGHIRWGGRIYGQVSGPILGWRSRVYHGEWGMAPFQSLYQPGCQTWLKLPLMPEWYLLVALLGSLAALGLFWPPLVGALPLVVAAAGISIGEAMAAARIRKLPLVASLGWTRVRFRVLTTCLHLIQPLARLWGRIDYGLAPWRLHGSGQFHPPLPRAFALWRESWRSSDSLLSCLENTLRASGRVRRGGPHDRWDLEIRSGIVASVRVLIAIEEHGAGQQLTWFRVWPRVRPGIVGTVLCLCILAAISAANGATPSAYAFTAGAMIVIGRAVLECGLAMGAIRTAIRALDGNVMRKKSGDGHVLDPESPNRRLPTLGLSANVPVLGFAQRSRWCWLLIIGSALLGTGVAS
jgi:O-antigen biosynthesis protein